MSSDTAFARRLRRLAGAGLALAAALASPARAQVAQAGDPRDSASFTVNGDLALRALASLADGHLRKAADVLTLLAAREDVRTGDWARVRGPLEAAARATVPAVHWFAHPDGRYWSIEQGEAAGTLATRRYFPRVLAGHTVVGDLVVSRSTGRNAAIVAVPVRGRGGAVVGMLGCSIHLDSLSALLRQELGVGGGRLLFFALDDAGLGAIHSDSTLIFTRPLTLGDAAMRQAFERILAADAGTVTYDFRGARRVVRFRRSPATGWRYGFGAVERATGAAARRPTTNR